MIYEDKVIIVYLVEVELNMCKKSWCNCQLYVKCLKNVIILYKYLILFEYKIFNELLGHT